MSALLDYRCPIHGRDLELHHDFDGDETGTWPVQWFECPIGRHTYHAEPNGIGDYYPVDDEAERCENPGCGTGALLDDEGFCPRCGARS